MKSQIKPLLVAAESVLTLLSENLLMDEIGWGITNSLIIRNCLRINVNSTKSYQATKIQKL